MKSLESTFILGSLDPWDPWNPVCGSMDGSMDRMVFLDPGEQGPSQKASQYSVPPAVSPLKHVKGLLCLLLPSFFPQLVDIT